jgi:predicted transcriptional regulator
MTVDFFVNDRYIVLKSLYEHQIDINGVMICPITQQELADNMGFSKAKVNLILNELITNQFVQFYNNSKGRYVLTDNALRVIKKLS